MLTEKLTFSQHSAAVIVFKKGPTFLLLLLKTQITLQLVKTCVIEYSIHAHIVDAGVGWSPLLRPHPKQWCGH